MVGLMPHPEHAVDPLTGPSADGLGFFTSVVAAGVAAMTDDGHGGAGGTPRPIWPQPYAELGPHRRRVREDRGHPRAPPDRRRAGALLGHVERALLVQVLQGAPEATSRPRRRRPTRCSRASATTPAWSTSARATRSPSRSSRTTTRRSWSRTRARPPASAASSGTSSPWARARSRSWTRCGSARPPRPTPRRVLPGVVSGISFYGNCLGLPNIGGELDFDPCYAGNSAGQRALRGGDAAR